MMARNKSKNKLQKILTLANVEINGSHPWDPQVHHDRFYERVLSHGSLGLGESYMDGWWECSRIDEFFHKVLSAHLDEKLKPWRFAPDVLGARIFNRQRKSAAFRIGEVHYDKGNDLYQSMLDTRMVYSCGYWRNASTLDEAQEAKLDLVCRKLQLKPGIRLLDIGCGWGSFMKFAAENYGVSAVGITVSKEQVELGKTLCKGLPIEIRLKDYRDVDEKFDHIVSIGMFEHVGYKNYREYMQVARRCLKNGGLFLLHTIGGNVSSTIGDPWIDKYIFPNGMVPSVRQIGKAIEGLFLMEDWHNFGPDYDKTLMAWFHNFQNNWHRIEPNYGKRFYRMWNYFLLSSAGSFRSRYNQVWQIVLSKSGVPGGYKPIR